MARHEQRMIFFDLDGCLVDSTEPIRTCLDAAFVEHGLPPLGPEDLRRHIGPPLQVSLGDVVLAHGRDPELVDLLVAAYRSRYTTMSVELAVAYPGVPELVAGLAGSGERVGVVTSKPQRFAVPILEALDLMRHFEVVVGPDRTEAEPKGETLGRALELVGGCDVPASVMVGDRHHDVDAAHAHGMAAIGVLWGFGSREELAEAGARAVVADADELGVALRAPTAPR